MDEAGTAPDNRRHHWVPASYLRPWQDKPGVGGHIRVQHRLTGKEILPSPKPEKMFRRRGFYDLSTGPIANTPAALLESGVFAETMEPLYAKMIRETFAVDNWPTLRQMRFMALYCFKLYFRGPKFDHACNDWLRSGELGEEGVHGLAHTATRTFVLLFDSNSRIIDRCAFRFFIATGERKFVTSDTPCWMWLVKGNEVVQMTSLADTKRGIEDGSIQQTRWVCALTPRYVVEICYSTDGPRWLGRIRLGDDGVAELNNLLTAHAEMFVVLPPGPT